MNALLRSNALRRWTIQAFSLIELLVTVAILSIMLALTVPPISQLMRSSGIATAGDQLLTTLSQARQIAASRNRTVEVRFYRYVESNDPPQGRFRAVQLFLIEPSAQGSTTQTASRKLTLPSNTYLSPTAALSSLIQPTPRNPRRTGSQLALPISPSGLNYDAASFQIFPDGTTNLPLDQISFVTIISTHTPDDQVTAPENFATIIIQPTSGKAQLRRP